MYMPFAYPHATLQQPYRARFATAGSPTGTDGFPSETQQSVTAPAWIPGAGPDTIMIVKTVLLEGRFQHFVNTFEMPRP